MTARLYTMTVRDLRDLLEGHDDDTLVVASCNYGDYGRTEQAVALGQGDLSGELIRLEESAYSTSGYAVPRDEHDQYECEECGNDEAECECEGAADPDPKAVRVLMI